MEMQTLPTPNTETIQPMTPPGSTTVSGSAGNIVSGNGSDSITCGQCSLKFFHVTQFLKHKSSCPGNSSEDPKIDESPSGPEEKTEETQKRGIYLCAECPTSVYPSSDLLRLHLLDAHGIYLPAGCELTSMLNEVKAQQVNPETARKFASRNGTQKTSTSSGFSEEQQNESQSVCSDNSSNRSVDDKSDSGNDSDIKKDFSATNISSSPNGSAGGQSGVSTEPVDSGNGEMRSPVAQGTNPTTPLKPNVPAGLPSLPSNMARSILENMVANRLRANLEMNSQSESAERKPLNLLPNPYGAIGALPFHQNLQAQFLAAQQANQAAAASASAAVALQQARSQQAANSPAGDNTLYQPAVKRRRRGYGSEVGTENLKILRDGEGYCCPLCNYKSRVRSNLTIHLRTHTGYKPYKCPYCPYSSSQSGPLKIHIRGHTGEKPYRCDYCSYASTCRGNLKVHQERHHKDEIAKHGLNAGIKGPNDLDDRLKEDEFENEIENKAIESNQTNPTMSTPPSTTPTTSIGSIPSHPAFSQARVPPFSQSGPFPGMNLPGVGTNPFSQLPGLSGLPAGFPGLSNLPGLASGLPAGLNPNLLAGLLKPKTGENSSPHFPLNMGQPSAETATVSEVKEEQMESSD